MPAANRSNDIELTHLGRGAHSDDFTIRDHLDRRWQVRAMAEQIAKDKAPLVLGLHGDWGSGKTSALRALRFHLTGENVHKEELKTEDAIEPGRYDTYVFTVWFEAWRYQNEAVPVVALLQQMRRQLSANQKIVGALHKLGTVALDTALANLDRVIKLVSLESLPLSAKDAREAGERYEREHLSQALATDAIQAHLEDAIAKLLPSASNDAKDAPAPRVVVFIDDLDRCAADTAFRLLEGLKIYLQLKNCVFVLGMNQQVVVEAIAERLKKDFNETQVLLRAEAYLEKLCCNIWRLPLPLDPTGYFASLVDDEAAAGAVRQAQSGSDGTAPCPSFLPPNPRRLRALANTYNRLLKAAQRLGIDMADAACLRLLVVAYLYQFHSDLYHRWHYDGNFLLRLQGWLSAANPTAAEPEAMFKGLSLPTRPRPADNTTEVPTGRGVDSSFPDPTSAGIFWIAPLLQLTLDKAVPDDFKRLLRLGA